MMTTENMKELFKSGAKDELLMDIYLDEAKLAYQRDRYVAAIEQFEKLRTKRGMNLVFICHSEVKKMQPPVGSEYTYIAPSLYAKTTQGDSTLKIYSDYVDIIAYCEFEKVVSQTSTGFGTRGQAFGTKRRIMHLDAANPAYIAGSRYPMPDVIDFDWNSFVTALTGKQPVKETATTIPTETETQGA